MYINSFSRRNPGLIVILIDQSAYMSAINEKGVPLEEIAANIANDLISDFILRFTTIDSDGEEIIKRNLRLVLIGYGGSNYEAYVICDKWIDEVESTYPKGQVKMTPREGTFPQDCIVEVDSVAEGMPDAFGAFSVAKDLVAAWILTHNTAYDPVPLIINISNNCTPVIGRAERIVNEIKEMMIPDGRPLVINCSVSDDTNLKTNYSLFPTCKDKYKSLEVLSSNIPHDYQIFEDGIMFIENVASFQDVMCFLWPLLYHPKSHVFRKLS